MTAPAFQLQPDDLVPGLGIERTSSVGRYRVLLAEDDEQLRALLAETLRQDGYDVVEARDGLELVDRVEEAAVQARSDGVPISLLISDVRMPMLTGLDVLHVLRVRQWTAPVMLITAFGDEATHREASQLEATAVLDKPFELERFRKEVEKCVFS